MLFPVEPDSFHFQAIFYRMSKNKRSSGRNCQGRSLLSQIDFGIVRDYNENKFRRMRFAGESFRKDVRGFGSMEKKSVEALLREGKTIQFHIQENSFSMYPTLYPGRDEAVVAPVDAARLKRGDVALYRRKNSILVLHRVVKHTADGIYMTGDNQSEIEGPLAEKQMLGIMTAFIRSGRRISAKNPFYVCAARLWLLLLPVRDPLKRTAARVKRLLHGNKK